MHEYGADAEWTDVDTITIYPKHYTETQLHNRKTIGQQLVIGIPYSR